MIACTHIDPAIGQFWEVHCDLCRSVMEITTSGFNEQKNEQKVIGSVYNHGWFLGYKLICPSCIKVILNA
jgi:hypothetical protein